MVIVMVSNTVELSSSLPFRCEHGDVLCEIGQRENGTKRLEEAVTAYRKAFKVITRERAPLDWAAIQSNLGIALGRLGSGRVGPQPHVWNRRSVAYREALKERTQERVPLDWAATQTALATALGTLGTLGGGKGRLEEARRGFVLAWGIYRDAGMDQYDPWFKAQMALIDDLIDGRSPVS
jgi:hypothetical protein